MRQVSRRKESKLPRSAVLNVRPRARHLHLYMGGWDGGWYGWVVWVGVRARRNCMQSLCGTADTLLVPV